MNQFKVTGQYYRAPFEYLPSVHECNYALSRIKIKANGNGAGIEEISNGVYQVIQPCPFSPSRSLCFTSEKEKATMQPNPNHTMPEVRVCVVIASQYTSHAEMQVMTPIWP